MTSGAMRGISSAVLRRIFADFAGMCMVCDCPYPNRLDDGTPIVELAYISSFSPGGARYDAKISRTDLTSYSYLVLLCSTHHRTIDSLPSEYTVDKLGLMRDRHIDRVAKILATSKQEPGKQGTLGRLREAFVTWSTNHENASEEFWHNLFEMQPELLAATVHSRAFTLNSKCYVGGKAIDNSGGNILDFLVQRGGDVVLIEIKTPVTRLLGPEYRKGVYPPSRELSGAVAQALAYRLSLLNDIHALRSRSPNLIAHSPSVFVMSGNASSEITCEEKRRSLEIYRTALKDVTILTYDELFDGLQALMIWAD